MIASILGSLQIFTRARIDDDVTDQLNYEWTGNILLAAAILVSFKQFGGKPIECIIPDQVHDSVEQFAENYCFAKNTYFLKWTDLVPKEMQDRSNKEISYYQWVPFFLLFEAACFQIPYLVWKFMASHSGIKIHDLVEVAKEPKNLEREQRQQSIKTLAVHLENALKFHRRLERKNVSPHRFLRCYNLPYTASYVSMLYIFVKLLYLFNAVAQFFLMNAFLETGHAGGYFGWGVLYHLFNGTSWDTSGAFPRVTLCDFEIRTMGNLHKYSIQCVLSINIFNEKIFIFLWFWYQILVIFTAASCLYWAAVLLLPCFSRWFVTRHLELCEMPFDAKASANEVHRFCHGYLHADGIFAIRMVESHSNVIFGTDLVLSLWKSFYGFEEVVQKWKNITHGLGVGDTKAKPPSKPIEPNSKDPPAKSISQISEDLANLRFRGAAEKKSTAPDVEPVDFASPPITDNTAPNFSAWKQSKNPPSVSIPIDFPEQKSRGGPRMRIVGLDDPDFGKTEEDEEAESGNEAKEKQKLLFGKFRHK